MTRPRAAPAPALLALLLASSSAGAEPTRTPFPGVIGADDRRAVEGVRPPWSAIGRVNIAGYRRTRHCTGTLVAPRLVVTAAHCLRDRGSGKPTPPRSIHFLAGARRGGYLAHARVACVRFLAGPQAQGTATAPARLQSDVAVLVLEQALTVPPLPLAAGSEFAPGLALRHPSYGRDRRHLLMSHDGCRLRRSRLGLWLTDCDTNFGGSGGPLLVDQAGGLAVAAVMAGVVRHRASIAVPVTAWRHLAAEPGCP